MPTINGLKNRIAMLCKIRLGSNIEIVPFAVHVATTATGAPMGSNSRSPVGNSVLLTGVLLETACMVCSCWICIISFCICARSSLFWANKWWTWAWGQGVSLLSPSLSSLARPHLPQVCYIAMGVSRLPIAHGPSPLLLGPPSLLSSQLAAAVPGV